MSGLTEPDDGKCVVVRDEDGWLDVFLRDDKFGAKLDKRPGKRWIKQHGEICVETWQELTEMGAVTYVGGFVDRRAL